jgi:hypothetical protein
MALGDIIPDLWSARLLVALRKNAVGVNLCNRDYEGEIRRQGDSVKITSIDNVTISDYTQHADLTIEALGDTSQSLLIDQAKAFAFAVERIEQVQAVAGSSAIDQGLDNASYQLADVADAFILDKINDAAEGTSTDLGTIAVHTDAEAMYDAFVDLNKVLSQNNVPKSGRFAVVSPAVMASLTKLNLLVGAGDALGADTRTTGWVGRLAGLDIFESNNLPAVTDAAATGGLVIAGHRIATTYADQIVETSRVPMERRFADLVKGLHVYGVKVTRPAAVAKVEFDATA